MALDLIRNGDLEQAECILRNELRVAEAALMSAVEFSEHGNVASRNDIQASNLVSSALHVAETTNRLLFLLLRKGDFAEIEYLATKCLNICQVVYLSVALYDEESVDGVAISINQGRQGILTTLLSLFRLMALLFKM